jgi:hypothetical protein
MFSGFHVTEWKIHSRKKNSISITVKFMVYNMISSCEHGDEPSGSLKCWEVPEWLHNWQLLRKGSAP